MHADKWGPIGSIFAALCCLGAAPVLAVLVVGGLWISSAVVALGLTLLVTASVWNFLLVRAHSASIPG